ncbi:NIF3-like protein 1 [Alligator mississippiensis]|uniref:NIF3-like protein 1 n=1 Tax=Alligator mississippiensis TaxID=8496 RepID=A0A151NAT6_ALLMI|nr:NIF3-like protein 1 [Alligator mississippiensis]
MELRAVAAALDALAPPGLAASWDNVGLLCEPSPPHAVRTLLLTTDLTEPVLDEALARGAELVLAYHPPLFRPLRRLTPSAAWRDRLLLRAAERRVGLYSPHTALDALPRGVNAWLAAALGASTSSVPIQPSTALTYPTEGSHRVEFIVGQAEQLEAVLSKVQTIPEVSSVVTLPARAEGEDQTRVSLNCSEKAMQDVVALLSQNGLYHKTEILLLQKPLLPQTGMGRLCKLSEPASLSALIERIKNYLKLSYVRLALGVGKTLESQIRTAAVCAGSGRSVLQGVEADLYLTGEMSHHEVLDVVGNGISKSIETLFNWHRRKQRLTN